MRVRIGPRPWVRAACWLLALGALAAFAPRAGAQVQPNFKPVERGDITEVEQKLLIVRGIEVNGDYAFMLRQNKDKDLTNLGTSTTMDQDFRLRLGTVINEDVAMKLTLQTASTSLDPTNLRTQPVDSRGREPNGQTLQLTAREAYLRYGFNPNSAINLGQFELELGDKRGKVFTGIASGIGFDCRVGTWCMPFGATKGGPQAADWIYHWALRYNAFDDPAEFGRRRLAVEIFRILYTESNVPLGNNLGPAYFNPSNGAKPLRVQLTDDSAANGGAGNPLYYDANGYNYFGLTADFQTSQTFLNFDLTNAQGTRVYHLYRDPSLGVTTAPTYASGPGPVSATHSIEGSAIEVEAGFRWAPEKRGQVGVRFMSASGDSNSLSVSAAGAYKSGSGGAIAHGLNGYYEITPGTYRGSRLYFNGADTRVDLGGGLGHSVNNKQLFGLFFDYADPENNKIGYSGGLYKLDLNDSILNAAGRPVKDVGVELDNMLTWYIHKRMILQFEVNVLTSSGAMSVDDFTPPPEVAQLFVQGIMRVVYRF